jgi:Spy/CpxP family protein refolding chaperone
MKLNTVIGILIVLLIVNVVAVDTYLYYHLFKTTAQPPLGPASGQPPADDPLATLTREQRNELLNAMEDFRKATGELHGRIKALDDEIFQLIQQDSIPKTRMEQNLQEISALRMQIRRLAIEKMVSAKSFLTPQQQERLFSAIFRTGPNVQTPGVRSEAPRQARKSNDTLWKRSSRPSTQPPPAENRLGKLKDALQLNDVQVAQVDRILKSSRARFENLRTQKIDDPSVFREQEKVIKDAEDAQIEKILTNTQKQKFTEMKQAGRERRSRTDEREGRPRP